MREIVFDTETTGMDPEKGDKIVEIGCLELENHIPTGRTFHKYINPERDVPAEVVAVHGLDNERLKDEPTFGEIVGDFMDFIGKDTKLIAHNAAFDMKFLNAEIATYGYPKIDDKRVIDSLLIARKKFPGSPASLDALCRRFHIDNTSRTLHGALLDSELLAEVYLELLGGRQRGLDMGADKKDKVDDKIIKAVRVYREARILTISAEEEKAHTEMLEDISDPIWRSS